MDDNQEKATKETYEFRLLKSNHFRVIHVDGAWGGITPRGDIHMVLYSERPAIPDKVIHQIVPGGLGPQVGTEGAGGIVIEVEADAVMNLNSARVLAAWLLEKVAVLEKLISEHNEQASVSEQVK